MPVRVGLKVIKAWHNDDLEKQVRIYEQEECEKGQIVFYGPSNFTRWAKEPWGNTPLREALPGKSGKPCCINRGFGSSCAEQQLYYYSRMVRPLEPKVLVYSPGLGNGTSFGYSPLELWELSQRVLAYAKADFPDLRIYLLGLNARSLAATDANKEYNGWLRGYCEMNPDCTYVNVAGCEAINDPDVYIEDKVHFNNEGYRRYAEFFKDVLKDELALY